jgi:hypothetical protein
MCATQFKFLVEKQCSFSGFRVCPPVVPHLLSNIFSSLGNNACNAFFPPFFHTWHTFLPFDLFFSLSPFFFYISPILSLFSLFQSTSPPPNFLFFSHFINPSWEVGGGGRYRYSIRFLIQMLTSEMLMV